MIERFERQWKQFYKREHPIPKKSHYGIWHRGHDLCLCVAFEGPDELINGWRKRKGGGHNLGGSG